MGRSWPSSGGIQARGGARESGIGALEGRHGGRAQGARWQRRLLPEMAGNSATRNGSTQIGWGVARQDGRVVPLSPSNTSSLHETAWFLFRDRLLKRCYVLVAFAAETPPAMNLSRGSRVGGHHTCLFSPRTSHEGIAFTKGQGESIPGRLRTLHGKAISPGLASPEPPHKAPRCSSRQLPRHLSSCWSG